MVHSLLSPMPDWSAFGSHPTAGRVYAMRTSQDSGASGRLPAENPQWLLSNQCQDVGEAKQTETPLIWTRASAGASHGDTALTKPAPPPSPGPKLRRFHSPLHGDELFRRELPHLLVPICAIMTEVIDFQRRFRRSVIFTFEASSRLNRA